MSAKESGSPAALKGQKTTDKRPNAEKAVADSWEDEDLSAEEDNGATVTPPAKSNVPLAPPPTPSSPSMSSPYFLGQDYTSPTSDGGRGPAGRNRPEVRPDKTDAVAKRLIAGALGVRAPKKTEEQKAYDNAMREKELKRRDAERQAQRTAQEEQEKARQAMWDG
ncbi:MAG: hypothetical protein M1814_006858 [Vezdaea aestivalis]|nr:MAG: hypothetical protein M1814_006858 [Vezdaea aestivalis]